MQEAVDLAHQKFGVVITDVGDIRNEPDAQPVVLADALIYQLGEIPGVNYYGRTREDYGFDGVRHLLSLQGTFYGEMEYLGLPLGYDWLYGIMSPQQREAIALELLANADPLDRSVYAYNTPPGSRLLGALAVLGDGIDEDGDGVDDAQALLNLFYDGLVFGDVMPFNGNRFVNFMGTLMFVPEGPGYEGVGYSTRNGPFYPFLEAWYDQTGEDYFQLPFLQNWVYYSTHVTGNEYEHYDKYYSGDSPWGSPRSPVVMPWLEAGLTRTNRTAASLAKYHVDMQYTRLSSRLVYMLRADPTIEPSSPAQLDLPTTAHFRGANSIFARNSWEGADATWVWFQSPMWTNIRDLGPLNDLVIWKNGSMLLGKHQQWHDYAGGNRTNTLVLYDEHQADKTYIPLNVMDDSRNYPPAGSRVSLKSFTKDSIAYHDGLRYFEEEPGAYLYAFGDGAQTFQSYPFDGMKLDLENWSRQFVWFRNDSNDEIDTFFVLDRIETPAESVSAQIPLHFGANPEIRNRETNSAIGEGVLDNASRRFTKVLLGGVVYYSVVDFAEGLTIEFVDPGVPNNPLSVSVADEAVTVSLGTDSSGIVVSKNAHIASLINSDEAASSLMKAQTSEWPTWNQVAVATNGPVLLVVGDGGIFKYDNEIAMPDDVANRIVATNTVTRQSGQAHGRLFVDTLWPKKPAYYRMGGIEERNIDLFGNLHIYALEVSGSPDDPENILKGMWRVQVADPQGGQNQTFLNVMQATDSSMEVPYDTVLLEGVGLTGAQVDRNIALFNAVEG